jgi:hypothetical protein
MKGMGMKRLAMVAAIVGTVSVVLAAPSPQVVQSQGSPDLSGKQQIDLRPERPPSSVSLASGALRSAVERLRQGRAAAPDVQVVNGKIRVEILHDLSSSQIRDVVTALGGVVEGQIEGMAQAVVPFDRLEALEAHDGVRFVRPPLQANVPLEFSQAPAAAVPAAGSIVGEEVAKSNADAWHTAGYTGAGVKVGIVDHFNGTIWNDAQAAGEVPVPAGTFCRYEGSNCSGIFWTPPTPHGVAVAEIIHEMAPDAQLYLATVVTTTDLQEAVDYFASQGVDIVSRSLTAQYDGPGDGTGPIATVIDNAVADGMAWFNSVGNAASDGNFDGQYWRGQWNDPDSDGWLDFTPGDEGLSFVCPFTNGVRWSDFGAINPTDYDVYVFDSVPPYNLIGSSEDDQTAGAPPLELDIPCTGNVNLLAIRLVAEGNGTAGDVLEFMTNSGALEDSQNPYSASGPASDTASPGALSVGAVDPAIGTDIAPYSSQGPTNDGLYDGADRIKPDISAASCVASFAYSPDCFDGTSAAAPAVAGAAAIVLGAGMVSTPAQIKTYLLNKATVDRGSPGPDNVYGAGELLLPAPPSDVDGDGCTDFEELSGAPPPKPGSTGDYDPLNFYDFYDVPVPAAPDPTPSGTRNGSVNFQDVLSVLAYIGAEAGGGPNLNGMDYDSLKDGDWNGDTVVNSGDKVGLRYDRSPTSPPNPPLEAGLPNGAVNFQDVLAVSCAGPP